MARGGAQTARTPESAHKCFRKPARRLRQQLVSGYFLAKNLQARNEHTLQTPGALRARLAFVIRYSGREQIFAEVRKCVSRCGLRENAEALRIQAQG